MENQELQYNFDMKSAKIISKASDRIIYEAMDKIFYQKKALKRTIFLNKEIFMNVSKRQEAIQQLEINNLQKIHKVFRVQNEDIYQIYTVSNIAFQSLESTITLKQAYSQNSMLGYLLHCLQALVKLRNFGYNHLNINPQNILFEQENMILCDPYLKQIYKPQNYDSSITVYKQTYLSPEQIQKKNLGLIEGEKSDIFQLGLSFLAFALHLPYDQILYCNINQPKIDELLNRLKYLGFNKLHDVLKSFLQVLHNFRVNLDQAVKLVVEQNLDFDLLQQENRGLYIQYSGEENQDENNINNTISMNQSMINFDKESQVDNLEQKVIATYQKSFYEQALDILDHIDPENLKKSLKLNVLYVVLLEKIAYHDRMNSEMSKLRQNDSQLRKQYLDSGDKNKIKDFLNYQRESIWHLTTAQRKETVEENKKLAEKHFGKQSLMYALSIYQMAKIECTLKDYEKSISLHEEAEKIFMKLDYNDFEIQQARAFNLKYCGNNYIYSKKYDKARTNYTKESEIWLQIGGDQYGEYGSTLQNLAICDYYQQNYEMGYDKLSIAISILGQALGVKNQYYSSALSWMVVFGKQLKKYKEAAEFSVKASILFLDTVKKSHTHYQNNIINLADNFANYQKNFRGCIQEFLLDRADISGQKEAIKCYEIALDCINSAETKDYVKAADVNDLKSSIQALKYTAESNFKKENAKDIN